MRKLILMIAFVAVSFSSFSQPYFGYPHYYGRGRGYYPPPPVYIPYGHSAYYYGGGYFYRPYGSYFRIVIPPIGIQVGFLPYGYLPIYVGSSLFYYYGGTYYRQYGEEDYRVVDPPMDAQIPSLPKDAKEVVVNGEKFYELNGTYYKQITNSKGETLYKVVGKNGSVNNTPDSVPPSPVPHPGDITDKLPDGCTTVNVNGDQYFVSPDNVYYTQVIDGNNKISYQVTSKPAENLHP